MPEESWYLEVVSLWHWSLGPAWLPTCPLPFSSASRRDSRWANSALVVTVQPSDWAHLAPRHGALAGVALQQEVSAC
jgi:hypothetical protein